MAVYLEENQIPFNQILLGNASAFMDLGAGIAGNWIPDGNCRNTSRAKAEQSMLRWLLPPCGDATPPLYTVRDFADIWWGNFRFNHGSIMENSILLRPWAVQKHNHHIRARPAAASGGAILYPANRVKLVKCSPTGQFIRQQHPTISKNSIEVRKSLSTSHFCKEMHCFCMINVIMAKQYTIAKYRFCPVKTDRYRCSLTSF